MTTFKMSNGTDIETGCVIDGHWGNYALSRMLEITDGILGTCLHAEAAQAWRESEGPNFGEWDGFTFEFLNEIADEAEAALNDQTPDGFLWHWHDGEFYVSPICEDDDCEDETCAHWTFG